MNRGGFRLRIHKWELQYDWDYGPAHKRGWTAVHDGSHLVQFVGFFRAVYRLVTFRVG
jgi:hypothetical protein